MDEQLDCGCQECQLDLDDMSDHSQIIEGFQRTSTGSSMNVNVRSSINSSALFILSAYWPTIQIIAALDSGSSRASRFSQSVGMIPSYLPGYRRKTSLMTIMASWTTYVTFVSMRSSKALMQRSAAASTLMASRPMERTALRTKSISTSDAYLSLTPH